MHSPPELLIFDWSGTISDDRRPVYEANQRMCDHFGVARVPFEEWLPKTAMTVFEFFRDAGINATDDDIWNLYTKTFNEVNSEHHLPIVYADAHEAIARLRAPGRTLAILSAHPQPNLLAEAKAYGLAPLFDVIQGDSRDKSEGMRDLLRAFNLTPERAVYVGDTIQDMRHAKAAGVCAVAITTGYHGTDVLRAESPDYLVNSLMELAGLFSSR